MVRFKPSGFAHISDNKHQIVRIGDRDSKYHFFRRIYKVTMLMQNIIILLTYNEVGDFGLAKKMTSLKNSIERRYENRHCGTPGWYVPE